MAQQTTQTTITVPPTGQMVATQPTVVLSQAPSTNVQQNYAAGQAMGLGCTQIVMGLLAIIFQGVLIHFWSPLRFVGAGIWCGIPVGTIKFP